MLKLINSHNGVLEDTMRDCGADVGRVRRERKALKILQSKDDQTSDRFDPCWLKMPMNRWLFEVIVCSDRLVWQRQWLAMVEVGLVATLFEVNPCEFASCD